MDADISRGSCVRFGTCLLPPPSMDLPHFPRELEREILEIAAETWSQEVPKLLLVAQRVYIWLEPFLYRKIHLYPGQETYPQEAFLKAASSKPPSFLARAVRRVIIDFSLSYGDCTPELLLPLTEALRLCTRITSFAMNRLGHQTRMFSTEIFEILRLNHLHCMGAFLTELMPSPIPMDPPQPVFCSLTHLEVFDQELQNDPRFLPFVVALPALTHLALKEHIQMTTMGTALLHRDGCRHLQVLVLLSMIACSPISATHKQWANSVGGWLHDPRVVITLYQHWHDCLSVQGHAYWREANMFVEKKRLGQIPDDHYWTGNFYLPKIKIKINGLRSQY
ncbi:hypothetical protein C8F01DRAFT_1379613, partial [Mycena amicta]